MNMTALRSCLSFLKRLAPSAVTCPQSLWLKQRTAAFYKARFLDAPISQAGLFSDTVEGIAQQFSAVQKQTEAIQHILPRRDAPSATAAPRARPQSARRPPELLRPVLNRHLGRRVEPLARVRRPPRPSRTPSPPGSQ